MEATNIFKVRLKTIDWKVLDKFYEKEANYKSYIDNKESYETIDIYTKRRFEQYIEQWIGDNNVWSYIDLLVYWDQKSTYGYEITTGIKIPLLLINEYTNTITGKKHKSGRRFKDIFCYNYSVILNYGCFGELNCYYINRASSPKLNFQSLEDVIYLKKYINSTHHKVEPSTEKLTEELEYAKQIVDEKINEMIRTIYEEEINLLKETMNYENDVYELLKNLKYQEHVKKEEVVVKKKSWWPFSKKTYRS